MFENGNATILYIKDLGGTWQPLGCLISNSITEIANTIKTTTRDNDGWSIEIPTFQSYDISFEALTSTIDFPTIASLLESAQVVTWKISDQTDTLFGQGYINRVASVSTIDEVVTFDGEIRGLGNFGEETKDVQLQGQLKAFFSGSGTLNSVREIEFLRGSINALFSGEGTIQKDIIGEYMQGVLNGVFSTSADLQKFKVYTDIIGELDGYFTTNATISKGKLYTLIYGTLYGTFSGSASLSKEKIYTLIYGTLNGVFSSTADLSKEYVYGYEIDMSTNGYSTTSGACAVTDDTVRYSQTNGIVVNTSIIYTDNTLTNPFNGGGLNYKYGFLQSIKVNSSGLVTGVKNC